MDLASERSSTPRVFPLCSPRELGSARTAFVPCVCARETHGYTNILLETGDSEGNSAHDRDERSSHFSRRSSIIVVGGAIAFALGCCVTGLALRWNHASFIEAKVERAQLEAEQPSLDSRQELLEQLQETLNSLKLHRLDEQQVSDHVEHSPSDIETAYDQTYCQRLADIHADRNLNDDFKTAAHSFHASVQQHELVSNLQHLVDGIAHDGRGAKGDTKLANEKSPSDDIYHDRNLLDGETKLATKRTLLGEPQGSKFAFVMMAHDSQDSTQEFLWGVLPMARALQKMSDYPLIVLTNRSHFFDGTPVAEALSKLNARARPVYVVEQPKQLQHVKWTPTWMVAFWKLQIWTLTEFDKLIWLDSDAILYRSVDWMFQLKGVWAQRDDWFCELNQAKVCSGILLVEPRWADFSGLVKYASGVSELAGGDQQLISEYFAKTHRPVSLLSDLDAAFGQCLGEAAPFYYNSDGTPVQGLWDIPAFVHKSGGWKNTNNNQYNNMCFSINVSNQRYRVGESTINACQFHPLGPYWRDLFCEATERVGISLPEVTAYCTDTCWYLGGAGTHFTGTDGAAGKDYCGPFNATLSASDYYSKTVGQPLFEITGGTSIG